MTYGLVLLGGVDRWDALFAIWCHLRGLKFGSVAKHAVGYVFVEIDVNSFDWSILHRFTRYCVRKRIVILLLPSLFLSLILDSLTLVLVVVYRLRHHVGEVVVEFANPQPRVLLQGHLWLAAEELDALLVFAVCLISKIGAVRQVRLSEFEIVRSRFHIGFPLTKIKIKYVINMCANSDFIPCVVAIQGVYIPLYHRIVNFLALVKLPAVHALLQFTWIEAILIIFFLSISFISFFIGFAFGIGVALRCILIILSQFTLSLLILIHCFKSLCLGAFLDILKFLFQELFIWQVSELRLWSQAKRCLRLVNLELSIHDLLYSFQIHFIYFFLIFYRNLIIFLVKLPNIWELLRHSHFRAPNSFNSVHIRINFGAICDIINRYALRHVLDLVLAIPWFWILYGRPLVPPSCYCGKWLLGPVSGITAAKWFITHSFCCQFVAMLLIITKFYGQLSHYLDSVLATVVFKRAATFRQRIVFLSTFKLQIALAWSWGSIWNHETTTLEFLISDLLWTVKNYVFYFHWY